MKHLNKLLILLLSFNLVMLESRIVAKNENHRTTPAQNKKLNQAKALTKNGLDEKAIEVYYDLYIENPTMREALLPLKQLLKKKKDVKNLQKVANIYLKRYNNSLKSKIDIIDILIWIDYPEWENILNNLPANKKFEDKRIKSVIAILINNQKQSDAINLINSARIQRKKDFYSYELGSYYALNFSVQESVNEFLLHLKYNPKKYRIIRDRILSFPDMVQLNNKIELILENDSSRESKLILSDIKFKSGDFQNAYELIKKYYSNENELITFAENLVSNKQYELSQIILDDILNKTTNKQIINKAIIILANLFEKMMVSTEYYLPLSNSINNNQLLDSPFIKVDPNKIQFLENAINIYDSLRINMNDFKSIYKLADIKYKILGDIDGSNILYNEILKNNKSTPEFISNASIQIIDLMIIKGNITLAKETLEKFEKQINSYELYTIKYLQILFYLNEWDEFNELSSTFLKKDLKEKNSYNDILKMTSNNLLFEKDYKNLNLYSESLLKIFQNKRTEAINILDSMQAQQNNELSNKIRYELAILNLHQGSIAKSLNILDNIDVNTAYIESASLLKAEIYDYIIDDKSKAVDTYLYILDNFPDSIYYESIRIRLRELTS